MVAVIAAGTYGTWWYRQSLRVDKLDLAYVTAALYADGERDYPDEAFVLMVTAIQNTARRLKNEKRPIVATVSRGLQLARDQKKRLLWSRDPMISGVASMTSEGKRHYRNRVGVIALQAIAGIKTPAANLQCVERYTRPHWKVRTNNVDRRWFATHMRLVITIKDMQFYCRT